MKKIASDLRVMVIYGWESNPYAECTIRALLASGVRVDFVTRESSESPVDHPRCTMHPVFPGHRKRRSHLSMFFLELYALAGVLRLVVKTRPDIVHYQSYRMIRLDWSLFLLLLLLGKKVVFTVHDTHSLEGSALDSYIFAETARRSDVLLVHNSNARQILIERWKVKPERIRVIPHGGYDHYYPRETSKSTARSQLGYDAEFLLLAFGTIRPYKGLDHLLPAVAEARKSIPALRLIVAGRAFDEALGKQYQRQISHLGLGETVRFENRFIEAGEVETLFSAADLIVLPYIRIDQSGVLFLAYTFGKPVLATRIGGLPELVREAASGYLVPPADSQALSAGIIRAWNERARLTEMGVSARRLIEQEYTWERQASITVEAYLSLVNAGASRGDGQVRPASVSRLG